MRVLLTGVTGQVGAALAPRLSSFATLVPADRSALDLTQPDKLAGTLDRLAPDLIVNPAAYTAVDRAEDEPELAFLVNAHAPGAMAAWAARTGVPLLHFSTDYVFDGTGDGAWRETDPTGPLSVYGASKLEGERAVQGAGGAHLVVRTSWVYAAKGSNFLRTIARLARERSELRVVDDQVGAPTSAALIAEAVAMVIGDDDDTRRARWSRAGGTIHLSASGETSWHGFASAIVEGLRARDVALAVESLVPITSAEFPTKARRPRNSRLDIARLRAEFGIETPAWSTALEPELDHLAKELV